MKRKDRLIAALEDEVKKFNRWYDLELYIEDYGYRGTVGQFVLQLLYNYIMDCACLGYLERKRDINFYIGYEYQDCFIFDRERQHYVVCFGGWDMIEKYFLKKHRKDCADVLRVLKSFKDKSFTFETYMEDLIEAQ